MSTSKRRYAFFLIAGLLAIVGITALWLGSLNRQNPRDPELVGQFIPGGVESTWDGPSVWGVAPRSDGVIFASDMGSGLWIVKPKGQAAP